MAAESPEPEPIASYLAKPSEVGRVLLLYSGGLDTSVMLKWIQDRYGAEVVALTVNLGSRTRTGTSSPARPAILALATRS